MHLLKLIGDSVSYIRNNLKKGRQELQLYAGTDAYKSNSNGAGIHLYGNGDSQHPGSMAFLTGKSGKGDAHFMIDDEGRATFGYSLWNWVDEGEAVGVINIKSPENRPGLYITGASASEGDIAFPLGEHLSIGTWDNGKFTEVLKITDKKVFINGIDILAKLESIH